jgi:glucokinase
MRELSVDVKDEINRASGRGKKVKVERVLCGRCRQVFPPTSRDTTNHTWAVLTLKSAQYLRFSAIQVINKRKCS